MLDREEQFEMADKLKNDNSVDKCEESEVKEKNTNADKKPAVMPKVKTESKPEVVVDKKGLDIHVPVSELGLNNLRGLVNIYFHIYNGPKWSLD